MLASYVIVALVACGASALTLFSGFGLGTLLLPTLLFFFPPQLAVAATAVVHFANNLFKLALLARAADWRVVIRFGIPAVAAAMAGAALLTSLAALPDLLVWEIAGRTARVTPIKLTMGVLILLFGVADVLEPWRKAGVEVSPRWLPLGGLLSGFFGGLSGHQGALRAAFLLPLRLAPQTYVATQAVLASLVDASRIAVYGVAFFASLSELQEYSGLVLTAALSAFTGVLIGRSVLPKVTVTLVRNVTATLMLLVAVGLGSGII